MRKLRLKESFTHERVLAPLPSLQGLSTKRQRCVEVPAPLLLGIGNRGCCCAGAPSLHGAAADSCGHLGGTLSIWSPEGKLYVRSVKKDALRRICYIPPITSTLWRTARCWTYRCCQPANSARSAEAALRPSETAKAASVSIADSCGHAYSSKRCSRVLPRVSSRAAAWKSCTPNSVRRFFQQDGRPGRKKRHIARAA